MCPVSKVCKSVCVKTEIISCCALVNTTRIFLSGDSNGYVCAGKWKNPGEIRGSSCFKMTRIGSKKRRGWICCNDQSSACSPENTCVSVWFICPSLFNNPQPCTCTICCPYAQTVLMFTLCPVFIAVMIEGVPAPCGNHTFGSDGLWVRGIARRSIMFTSKAICCF